MIRNDNELTVVRNQLSLVEDALASLRRDVLPRNKRNYEVLAEGYVDQIAALRAEIDAYLGVVPENERGRSEVAGVIRSIDLDSQTFVIRDRADRQPDLVCEYDEQVEDIVKSSLDNRVMVTGVIERSRKTKREKMEVEAIEILPGEEDLNPHLEDPHPGRDSERSQA